MIIWQIRNKHFCSIIKGEKKPKKKVVPKIWVVGGEKKNFEKKTPSLRGNTCFQKKKIERRGKKRRSLNI